MINVLSSYNGMKSEVFQGTFTEIQQALAAFLKDKNIKLHSFTQSQSSVNKGDEEQIIITATLIYSEYGAERKSVPGFHRD